MSAFLPPAAAALALARVRALATLRALARGLPSGTDGAERLLERIAAEDRDDLRAALLELGALAVVRDARDGDEQRP